MLTKLISNLKGSSLKYKKGFFELTFTGNSPEKIVNSSSLLSFIKHHKKDNYVKSNTLFFDVELNYFNVAEGLWVFYTETKHKRDMKIIAQHDKNDEQDNYYTLLLNVNSDRIDLKTFGNKETYTATKYFWGFFKPKNTVATYHYKNSTTKYITISFNKNWMDKNFAHLLNKSDSKIGEFLESDKKNIICAELNENLKIYFNELYAEFISYRESKFMNLLQLQGLIYRLISCFVERIENETDIKENRNITDEQKNLVLKIERYLQTNLNRKFEGIDYLTKKFNISETKLKYNFKQTFGVSVYQYFNKHQMYLAKQILEKDKTPIKEIAHKFGYESPGKFTEAFKKHVGQLPSEI